MKRRTAKNPSTKLMTLWADYRLIAGLERGVRLTDSDKSKFVRTAIREKLARHGIEIQQEAVEV